MEKSFLQSSSIAIGVIAAMRIFPHSNVRLISDFGSLAGGKGRVNDNGAVSGCGNRSVGVSRRLRECLMHKTRGRIEVLIVSFHWRFDCERHQAFGVGIEIDFVGCYPNVHIDGCLVWVRFDVCQIGIIFVGPKIAKKVALFQ